jgi:hypothetical protein
VSRAPPVLQDPRGLPGLPVRLVLREVLGLQDQQDHRDPLVSQAPPAQPAPKDHQALQGSPDPQVLKDHQALQEPLVPRDRLAQLAQLDPLVPRDPPELLGLLGFKDLRVSRVLQVPPVRRDHPGLQEPLDPPAHKDHLGPQEQPAHRAAPGLQEPRVHKDHLV